MSQRNWLDSQLDKAKQEVQAWNEWKRDAMRQSRNVSLGKP